MYTSAFCGRHKTDVSPLSQVKMWQRVCALSECLFAVFSDAPSTGWGAGENGMARIMECFDPAISDCRSRPPALWDLIGVKHLHWPLIFSTHSALRLPSRLFYARLCPASPPMCVRSLTPFGCVMCSYGRRRWTAVDTFPNADNCLVCSSLYSKRGSAVTGPTIGNHALELDGVDDYFSISMQNSIQRYEDSGNGFTISAWLKKEDCTGSFESIFSQSADPEDAMHSLANSNIQVRYGSCGASTPYVRINLVNSVRMWGRADALIPLENAWYDGSTAMLFEALVDHAMFLLNLVAEIKSPAILSQCMPNWCSDVGHR
eukprot:SAG31_NODE_1028_length_10273_cov_22.700413_2_plen_317_part_00